MFLSFQNFVVFSSEKRCSFPVLMGVCTHCKALHYRKYIRIVVKTMMKLKLFRRIPGSFIIVIVIALALAVVVVVVSIIIIMIFT